VNGRAAQRRENVALIKAWGHAVYSGRLLRGTVTPCESGDWLAENADGQIIGTRRTEKLAVAAVLGSYSGRGH